jgi:hypothetical protein
MLLFALVMSVVTSGDPPDHSPRTAVTAHMHRLLTAPNRNVRTFNDRVTTALFAGARRSATFASLVTALDGSDVIAYIELAHDLPAMVEGRLLLATTTVGHRYVRIQIRATQSPDEIIAIIGHELQHAVEIARAPGVQDDASMRRHYERAGAGRSTERGFETQAAQDAGRRVRGELRRNA